MELSKPLSKKEISDFEKLKQKWKELSIEVIFSNWIFIIWIFFLFFFYFQLKDIILDGLYSNSVRLVKEYAEKILKIDLKLEKINEIGLKSVLQLLADRDLRGAELLLNHMVNK